MTPVSPDVVSLADSTGSRAIRLKAITALYIVVHMGTRAQHKKAAAAFEKLVGDSDPLVAESAQLFQKRPFDRSEMFVPVYSLE